MSYNVNMARSLMYAVYAQAQEVVYEGLIDRAYALLSYRGSFGDGGIRAAS
jgi:hypothetical protein